jgi:hypothetical protein
MTNRCIGDPDMLVRRAGSTDIACARLGGRTEDLRRLIADAHNTQITLQWQLVAALVRQVVPEATGVRLEGHVTEQGSG